MLAARHRPVVALRSSAEEVGEPERAATCGEFLRRSQRRVDARAQLRAALELFEDLRAEPLAARAGRELRA